MWSDNESDVDLLQFKYLASAIQRIVKTSHLLPTTIGVFGDWGSGKSSLLKMVRLQLQKDPDIMCLTFSGWLFESYEDAKTSLMGTILEAIEDRIKQDATVSDKAKQLLDNLLERVNWLRLATMAGKYAAPTLLGQPHLAALVAGSDALESLLTKLKAKVHEPKFTAEDFKKLLNPDYS